MKRLLAGSIRAYQYLLSPWVGNQCRFYPTCSEYARLAIMQHGSFKGGGLAVKRLIKCHPFHAGGIDLVPATRNEEKHDG
jgi:putative membrane protein insertion efficiency factor